MLRPYAGLPKLLAAVNRVRHVDRKQNRLPPLAVLVVLRADVANELGLVHPLGKLTLIVFAGDKADAFQHVPHIIGSVDDRRDRDPEPAQFLDRRAAEHPGEHAAEPSAISTTWRCR